MYSTFEKKKERLNLGVKSNNLVFEYALKQSGKRMETLKKGRDKLVC